MRYFLTDDAPTFPSVAGGGRSLAMSDGTASVPVREPLPTAAVDIFSSLGDTVDVLDGEWVATITLVASDGREWSIPVRAGEHTAEWLYDAPGVAGSVQHRMAPVARATPRAGGGQAHVYRASFDLQPLGQPELRELRLQAVHPRARWNVDRILFHTPFGARSRLAHREGRCTSGRTPGRSPVPGGPGPTSWWTARRNSWSASREGTSTRDRSPSWARRCPAGPRRRRCSPPPGGQADHGEQTDRPARPPAPGPSTAPGTARVLRLTANTRRIEVDAPDEGLLVISETWSPGWQAWVDGRPVRLYGANGMLQAVPVPPGEHRVDLRYRPWSVVLGGTVSAITLLGMSLWALLAVRSRPGAPRDALPPRSSALVPGLPEGARPAGDAR